MSDTRAFKTPAEAKAKKKKKREWERKKKIERDRERAGNQIQPGKGLIPAPSRSCALSVESTVRRALSVESTVRRALQQCTVISKEHEDSSICHLMIYVFFPILPPTSTVSIRCRSTLTWCAVHINDRWMNGRNTYYHSVMVRSRTAPVSVQ